MDELLVMILVDWRGPESCYRYRYAVKMLVKFKLVRCEEGELWREGEERTENEDEDQVLLASKDGRRFQETW